MSEDNVADANEQDPKDDEQTTASEETKKPRSRTRARTKLETTPAAASETAAKAEPVERGAADERDSLDRAEQIVAEWTVRAEQIGTELGHRFVRLFARAREEAEDIWAEAQELRRNEGAQQGDNQQ